VRCFSFEGLAWYVMEMRELLHSEEWEQNNIHPKHHKMAPNAKKNRANIAPPFAQSSQTTHRAPQPSQRRAVLHRHPRAHAPQHGREHQRPRQVVEYFPAGGFDRGGRLPGVVVEAVL